MASTTRLVVSIIVIAGLAIAFWVLALSPKKKEADKLDAQVQTLQASLSQAQGELATATAARKRFPADYQQVVLLGKAVPSGDDTSSLLVELSKIAEKSRVTFDGIALGSSAAATSTTTAAPVTTPVPAAPAAGGSTAVPASSTVPPTEAAAALLPIGATVGTAGLGVLPYDLSFSGNFFHMADFIKGIDDLVATDPARVAVDGRLITIDGFALSGDSNVGFPTLKASFMVTAYLTPPGQGLTAGATPSAPADPSTLASAPATPPVDSIGGAAEAAKAAANSTAGTATK
jgi:Tfp pilus assembly protein PilO